MTGAMIIDLGKRAGRRALKVAASALSWQGWNAANPAHPKGPDGRWVKGHPFVGLLGDAPDHIHHMSDEDLVSAKTHAGSLTAAIDRELGRRQGVGHSAADIPASRTYGTRPLSGEDEDDFDRAIRAQNEPTITPESAAPKSSELPENQLAHLRLVQQQGGNVWGGAKPGTGLRPNVLQALERRGYLERYPSTEPPDDYPGATRLRLTDKGRAELGSPAATNPAKPLRARRATEVPESLHEEFAEMRRRPMPADEKRLDEVLKGLTIPQLKSVAERYDIPTSSARTKAEHVAYLKRHLVSNTLQHETIVYGGDSSYTGSAHQRKQSLISAQMHGVTDRAEYERLHQMRVHPDVTQEEFEQAERERYAMPGSKEKQAAWDAQEQRYAEERALREEAVRAKGKRLEAGKTGAGLSYEYERPESPTERLAQELRELPATEEGIRRASIMLAGMRLPELKEIQKELGPAAAGGRTKKDILHNIIEGSVGYRASAAAMGANWPGIRAEGGANPKA